ncbi:ribosome-associated translation inhibitor RaiA [Candidatus Wolfebacteria bacterium]|nr:ribosome-associated translation inhibitor RaiA [Candidatus Wolfebacteria bacterium]
MINTNIKATNIELTPAIRAYVEEKVVMLGKLIDPNDTIARADVEVGQTTKHHQSGDIFRAEINLHIAGADLRTESEREDLYAAIDEAKDELMRQLRKEKTKRTDLVRRGGLALKRMLHRFSRSNEAEDNV